MMATSLIKGAAIRKENVTPRGMPDSTNPRKSGMAEQEQKGVTIPKRLAIILPTSNGLPSNDFRVFSGEKKERIIPTRKITMSRSRKTFMVVLIKNQIVSDRFPSRGNRNKV